MKSIAKSPAVIILNLMLKTATSKATVIPVQQNGNTSTAKNEPVANLNIADVKPAIMQAPANQVVQPIGIQGANVIEQPISLQGTVIPKKVTWTVNSSTVGYVAQSIYLFNNSSLNALAVAPLPTVTVTDGFVGKLIERLLIQAGDKGVQCYGFNVTCTDTTTGLPDTASLNAMSATLLNYTGTGANAVPTSFDVSGTERKTDFKDGIMTIISPFILYSLGQFQYQQPANKLFQFTFYFTPIVN